MDTIRNWSRVAFLLALIALALLCVPTAMHWNALGLGAALSADESVSSWHLYLPSLVLLGVCSGVWYEALQVRALEREVARYEAENNAAHSTLASQLRDEHRLWARSLAAMAATGGLLELILSAASAHRGQLAAGLLLIACLPGAVLYAVTHLRASEALAKFLDARAAEQEALRDSPLTGPNTAPRGGSGRTAS